MPDSNTSLSLPEIGQSTTKQILRERVKPSEQTVDGRWTYEVDGNSKRQDCKEKAACGLQQTPNAC
jgi:hypothetical protein